MAIEKHAPVVFRRLWPRDRTRLQRHLLRLDDEDRRLRFGGAASDQEISEYCTGLDWTQTVLIGCEVGRVLRGVGELKIIGHERQTSAEAAITVERAWQGRGLGGQLFGRLTTLAANRGIRRLIVICAPHNRKVQRIVRRHGAELIAYPGEVEGQIELPWPSHLTVGRELLDEYVATLQSALAPRPARG